jgi:hypothetical protein
MTKAYLTGPRPIKLANGAALRNGQIIGGNDMQRKLNTSYNIARDGASKRLTDPAPVAGHRSRTTESGLAFKGSKRPLDDEPMAKNFLDGKSAPINLGTAFSKTCGERGTDKGPDHGSAILQEASRLGRPPEKT